MRLLGDAVLVAAGRIGGIKCLWRIEQAGMPQSGIRQIGRNPLPKRGCGGRDHAAIGRVENHHNALQFRWFLRNFSLAYEGSHLRENTDDLD
jgi:hypothetical protein